MSAVQDMHAVWGRSAARRRHDEADLMYSVKQYLEVALPPDAVFHHSPGEGKRTLRAQAELKRSGFQAGWPDIEIVWRGRFFGIELKAPDGALSAAQRHMHKRLLVAGADVMLCRSVEDVEAQLREACIPLRAGVTKQQQQQRINGHV